MKRDLIYAAIAIILLSFCGYLYLSKPKVGYVKSELLIQKFKGTLEVSNKYQSQSEEFESNYSVLSSELDSLSNKYQLTKDKKILPLITQKQSELEKYGNASSDNLSELNKQLMQGALNQINSFLILYGKEKGFLLIFGTTANGNILYGEESIDITDDVIEYVNNKYVE